MSVIYLNGCRKLVIIDFSDRSRSSRFLFFSEKMLAENIYAGILFEQWGVSRTLSIAVAPLFLSPDFPIYCRLFAVRC